MMQLTSFLLGFFLSVAPASSIFFQTQPFLRQTHLHLFQTPVPKQAPSGLFGYADEHGKFVIAPAFEQATAFANGIARVRQHGLWGLISEKGSFVLKPAYAEIQEFKNQTALIARPGVSSPLWLYGLIDEQGRELIVPQFHYLTPDYLNQLFIAGNIIGYENGNRKIRFGLINRKNTRLLPLAFKDLRHARFRTFAGKDETDRWTFFDNTGNKIFGNTHQEIAFFDEKIAVVRQASGWGIVLADGKYATDTVFQAVRQQSAIRFALHPFPQKRVLNEQNHLLFATAYPDLQALGEERFAFTENSKKGLLDATGKPLTPADFLEISPFHQGNCLARKAEGTVVLTKTGQPLLAETFESARIDSLTGTITATRNHRCRVIDRAGKTLTQVQYDEIRLQPYGMMFARQGSQWFLLDAQGKLTGSRAYETVSDFQPLLAIVRWKGQAGVIDMKSNWLIEPVFDSLRFLGTHLAMGVKNGQQSLIGIFSKQVLSGIDKAEALPGSRFFRIFLEGKQGLVDFRGREIISARYDGISDFTKDSLLTVTIKDKKGLVNMKGVAILPPESGFEEMQVMQEERLAVKIKGKFGFIDRNGGLRIANRYQAVQPFCEGLAAYKLKGKWGFLNLKEELVIQPQYEQVCNFNRGVACVRKQDKWAFINKQGREILRPQYDKITALPSGKYVTEENGKKGLVSAQAKEILHPGFDTFQWLPDGNLLVSRSNKWGLLSGEGAELIPVMYDALVINGIHVIATLQPPDVIFEVK